MVPGTASAQQAAETTIDPLAIEIAVRAADFLSEQPRVAFNWFNSYDVVIDGREKITYTLSGSSFLSRNEGFYSMLDHDGDYREYLYDGATFVVHHIEENAFSEIPFAGSFEELIVRLRTEYGMIVPMWEVLSRDANDQFLDGVEAAAYLGETRLAGNPVHHLAFSEYDHDWQIWISTDDERPVIHAIVGTEPHVQGWPQYHAYLGDWDFVSLAEKGAFAFTPADDAVRMTLPKAGDDGLTEPLAEWE